MSDLVPEGWRAAKFVDVFDNYKYGPRFSSKDYADNGNVRTIRGTDVSTSGEIQYAQVPIATIKQDVVDAHSLKQNDLVMITTADCGATAVFNKQNIPYIASAYAIKLTPTKKIESKYILYFMQTPEAKRQVDSLVRKGTVANLPGSDVMNLRFMCPPLPEQQKIAAILSSVDEVIEKTQAQINKLKDLKTGMMQELLSPREGQAANISNPQGDSKNGLHHTEFKDSPLGRIPVGWEVVTLNDLIKSMDGGVSVNGDNRQKNTDEIGVLKVSSVFKGRFLPNNHKAVIKEDEARVKLNPLEDRILFSRANTPELVGESGYIDKDYKDLFLPDKIWMIDVKDRAETNVKWLSYVLCSGQVRKTIADVATGTSGSMKNISKPNLLGIRIALPSFREQVRIAAAVQSVDDNLYLTADKLEHTKSIKKALMQDLLTGKVRVKVEAA
jgi:type I restriction enzyme S subunit